jgi:hypothetical protein
MSHEFCTTNSVMRNASWVAKSHSHSQKIYRFLLNSKVYYNSQKIPPRSQSSAERIQCTPRHLITVRSILILSYQFCTVYVSYEAHVSRYYWNVIYKYLISWKQSFQTKDRRWNNHEEIYLLCRMNPHNFKRMSSQIQLSGLSKRNEFYICLSPSKWYSSFYCDRNIFHHHIVHLGMLYRYRTTLAKHCVDFQFKEFVQYFY